MAPKSIPPAAKQALIVKWFHDSRSAHSFKELEKVLPQIASIPQMQVKDYIQTLMDENQIRVEKIGSGNWYWSFAIDVQKSRETVLRSLRTEESKLKLAIAAVEGSFEEEVAQRDNSGEMLDENGMDREASLKAHAALLRDNDILDKEMAGYSDTDPTEILRKIDETERLRESAGRWTDNLEAIEAFMIRESGNRDEVRKIMQQVCGEEYVPGEGLKEL
ncbi:MAG: hypothetical protein M1818_007313 [Claussenomyces sp. TS43310]|nr:MAG: hypothetical protein M1818_007313 [Claussenomyces sp. TS43310]